MHAITSAPVALRDDMARRTRRYLVQMGIRVVCFVAAVLAWGHAPAWVLLGLVATATVMPYVAVLLANAGRERDDTAPEAVGPVLLTPGAAADRTGYGRDQDGTA